MLQTANHEIHRSQANQSLDVEIVSIATAVPEHVIDQEIARDLALIYCPHFTKFKSLFTNTGINTRYSCVPLTWHDEPHDWPDRAVIYQNAAPALLEQVSRSCLEQAGLEASDIDAIIVASTTGLSVPSLDAVLANRLNLPDDVERLPIFGLGCAGGVTGLARAMRIAQASPGAHILFLTVELCTINYRRPDKSMANFVSSALFGDGAAGVVLRNTQEGLRNTQGGGGKTSLGRIVASAEHMWRETEYVMGWSIEEEGFGVVISPDIPKFAQDKVLPPIEGFLKKAGVAQDELSGFVFHPGGRKVLESLEDALNIDRSALKHSWDVLEDFGNMSSPTVLFVLERTLKEGAKGPHLMGAFGPGFTISLALLDF